MMHIRPSDEFLAQPYWRHLASGTLQLNRCDACGAFRNPPGPVCPKCRTIGDSWAPVSGRATLNSFTEVHHPVHPILAERTPYVVTLVDLEEGVRMVSGIPSGMTASLTVGMPLRCKVVAFDKDFALPYFLPIDEAGR
jgi:uncharacterized OB-fold protein